MAGPGSLRRLRRRWLRYESRGSSPAKGGPRCAGHAKGRGRSALQTRLGRGQSGPLRRRERLGRCRRSLGGRWRRRRRSGCSRCGGRLRRSRLARHGSRSGSGDGLTRRRSRSGRRRRDEPAPLPHAAMPQLLAAADAQPTPPQLSVRRPPQSVARAALASPPPRPEAAQEAS